MAKAKAKAKDPTMALEGEEAKTGEDHHHKDHPTKGKANQVAKGPVRDQIQDPDWTQLNVGLA